MKPKKLTLISITLLAILLIGAGVVVVLSQKPVGANVKWDPKGYTWRDGAPDPWNAEIGLKGGHKAQTEINATTIRLEGQYSNSSAIYNATHGPRIIVPFNGNDVKAALDSKLPYHMGSAIPGRYRLSLDINGTLYTGEEFQGSGIIVVTVPEDSG